MDERGGRASESETANQVSLGQAARVQQGAAAARHLKDRSRQGGQNRQTARRITERKTAYTAVRYPQPVAASKTETGEPGDGSLPDRVQPSL